MAVIVSEDKLYVVDKRSKFITRTQKSSSIENIDKNIGINRNKEDMRHFRYLSSQKYDQSNLYSVNQVLQNSFVRTSPFRIIQETWKDIRISVRNRYS